MDLHTALTLINSQLEQGLISQEECSKMQALARRKGAYGNVWTTKERDEFRMIRFGHLLETA